MHHGHPIKSAGGMVRIPTSRALQNPFRIGDAYEVPSSLTSIAGPAGTTRLEPKAITCLSDLRSNRSQAVASETLMRTVWPGRVRQRRRVDALHLRIRKVLEDDAKEWRSSATAPAFTSRGRWRALDARPDVHILRKGRSNRHCV